MKITSSANPRVKAAAKLRNGRQRARQGRFMINGVRELSRALDAGMKLHEVFVCHELCESSEGQQLLSRLERSEANQFEVTPSVYEILAYGSRRDGVLAVARMPECTLEQLQLPERPLVTVLEGIEKPGNIGAVLRSADGAGVSAVIVADGGVDLYNPNAIRASMGTIFTLPVCAASSVETLAWLRKQKLVIYAARVDGSIDYTAADFARPSAIVLGSESAGLSETWTGHDIMPIRLPMLGIADSLNISAAAAVLFYEALRQRGL